MISMRTEMERIVAELRHYYHVLPSLTPEGVREHFASIIRRAEQALSSAPREDEARAALQAMVDLYGSKEVESALVIAALHGCNAGPDLPPGKHPLDRARDVLRREEVGRG